MREFVYGHPRRPNLREDEICVILTGKRLIEASSRPTRTYVNFDREVFRDLIESYASSPVGERYFLLDREFHFFDMDYLKSRFRPFYQWKEDGNRSPVATAIRKGDGPGDPDPFSGSAGETPSPDTEQEDMYEALADA